MMKMINDTDNDKASAYRMATVKLIKVMITETVTISETVTIAVTVTV